MLKKYYLFTKRAILIRRSTVVSLSRQLGFPARTMTIIQLSFGKNTRLINLRSRVRIQTGNTKGGKYHFTSDLLFDWFVISCVTTDNFVFICKTDSSKPVKQEVNGTVILPPLVFPDPAVTNSTNREKIFRQFCVVDK
jgi:hypothetical protein